MEKLTDEEKEKIESSQKSFVQNVPGVRSIAQCGTAGIKTVIFTEISICLRQNAFFI